MDTERTTSSTDKPVDVNQNFDVIEFEKRIRGKVVEARTYVNVIRTLRRHVATHHNDVLPANTTQMLYDYITKNVPETEWALYCKAIRKYEVTVLKSPGLLFYGPLRHEVRFKIDEMNVKEPVHTRMDNVRRINSTDDERLKTQLLLQLYSGVRLSEVSALVNDDIKIVDDERLLLHLRHAKGDVELYTVTLPNKELVDRVRNGVNMYPASEYGLKASELGIATHDLRKHNIRDRYKIYRSHGLTQTQAAKRVRDDIGHKKLAMTKAYLGKDFV